MNEFASLSHPWDPLTGNLAIITGAAGGLGRQMASRLLEVGASVLASDLSQEALDAMESDFNNPKLMTQRTDVTHRDDMQSLAARATATGLRPVLWVNNAGISINQDTVDATDADYDRIFNVNLRSTLIGSQVAQQLFAEQNQPGSIVNLSSVTGTGVLRRRALYGSAKAAIVHMTKYLAEEWGQYGIRVNAIAPGFVLTPISHLMRASQQEIDEAVSGIPLGRLGTTDDIAKTVVLLGSNLTGYQTGQVFVLDGGMTLSFE